MSGGVKGGEYPLLREILGTTCVDYRTLGPRPESDVIEEVEQLLKDLDFVLFFSNRPNEGKFDLSEQTIEQHLNRIFPEYYSTCIENPLVNFRLSSKQLQA